jgi:hypothetical protein
MKNLATISKTLKISLRKIFANAVIKQRSKISNFPSVDEFFRSRSQKYNNVEVIIVNGDLYKGEEYVYGAFFSGSEDRTDLQVKNGESVLPFSISTDVPMIVLGNSDKLVLETTMVHELYHFMVPDRPSGEYATDPDEMGARNFEREFLKKYYRMNDAKAESFMRKKYLN